LDKAHVSKFNAIVNKAAILETRCDLTNFPEKNKRLVAEALARALDRDLGAAGHMLDNSEQIINTTLKDERRIRYLVTGVVSGLPFILVVLFGTNWWFSGNPRTGY
jgi:hypothetical protein